MDVLLVYVGFCAVLVGFISIIKPLKFLKIRSRRMGTAVLLSGLGLAIVAMTWPVGLKQATGNHRRIDDFLPAYHFHEIHSIRIHAPPDRVFRAIKAVTPQEILFLRPLLEIRQFPERLQGKPSTPLPAEPILEAFVDSGFLLLAEELNQEIALGTTGQIIESESDEPPPEIDSPQAFVALKDPGYAKVVMTIYIEDEGEDSSRVTTETRIFANDPATLKRFAAYWRVIYPGSAILRITWLWAINQRVQDGAPK